MIPMDYSCKFLMGETASMITMDCVCPVKGGGPLFVLHSYTHTVSLDTRAQLDSLGLKYLQS